jgi:coenzyme F420-reducing hydrogenase delta subunit
MLLNTIMRQLGLDGRLKWEFIGVPMWRELADAVHKMDKTLKALGPSPLRRKT